MRLSIQYNTIQYNTLQYNTIQYNTIQYNKVCRIHSPWPAGWSVEQSALSGVIGLNSTLMPVYWLHQGTIRSIVFMDLYSTLVVVYWLHQGTIRSIVFIDLYSTLVVIYWLHQGTISSIVFIDLYSTLVVIYWLQHGTRRSIVSTDGGLLATTNNYNYKVYRVHSWWSAGYSTERLNTDTQHWYSTLKQGRKTLVWSIVFIALLNTDTQR